MRFNNLFSSHKFLAKSIKYGFVILSGLSVSLLAHNCSSGSRTKKAFRVADKFVAPHKGRKWGPEMVYTPGGCTQMGGFEGCEIRTVTVSAFYISKYTVSNREYLTYLDDLQRSRKMEAYKKALLDMTVWNDDFIWNDSLKDYPYARVFLDYPVVGITYLQSSEYCKWLTEKEFSMIHKPVKAPIKKQTVAKSQDIAQDQPSVSAETNTASPAITGVEGGKESALATSPVADNVKPIAEINSAAGNQNTAASQPVESNTQNQQAVNNSVSDLSKTPADQNTAKPVDAKIVDDTITSELSAEEEEFMKIQNEHKARLEQAVGEQMYFYRLPTEAEWEYAAKASIISQNLEGVESTVIVNFGNIKSSVRYPHGPNKGDFVGLFKRFPGNYKGIPGTQPTDAPTEQVDLRVANGFGLKGCYGNVWEITADVYRHEPAYMKADYNPSRVNEKLDDKYDETSPLSKKCRVARGGSYKQSSNILRTYVEEDVAYNDVGFRIVSSVC